MKKLGSRSFLSMLWLGIDKICSRIFTASSLLFQSLKRTLGGTSPACKSYEKISTLEFLGSLKHVVDLNSCVQTALSFKCRLPLSLRASGLPATSKTDFLRCAEPLIQTVVTTVLYNGLRPASRCSGNRHKYTC